MHTARNRIVPQEDEFRMRPADSRAQEMNCIIFPSLPFCLPSPRLALSPSSTMVAFFKTDSVPYRPLVAAPRSLSSKFFLLLSVFSVVSLTTYLLPAHLKPEFPSFPLRSGRTRGTCPPRSWAAGKWVPKPPPTIRTNFSRPEDAHEFLGLEGCASSREYWWHLGADNEHMYDRFPAVASWAWKPRYDCDVQELDTRAVVMDLVEQGGWFLVGGEFDTLLPSFDRSDPRSRPCCGLRVHSSGSRGLALLVCLRGALAVGKG